MLTTKRVIVTILVIFAIYAVFTAPRQSANNVDEVWQTFKDGFNSVQAFFDELLES